MKPVIFISILTILFLHGAVCLADSRPYCASIKTIKGDVTIIHQTEMINAEPGAKLFNTDSIKTGDDSHAGIIFQDDTIISLGPDSELSMDEFIFNPKKKEFLLVTRMLKGTFLFISGVIGKLSPESVRIETPDGTIGIRGTKFLVEVVQ